MAKKAKIDLLDIIPDDPEDQPAQGKEAGRISAWIGIFKTARLKAMLILMTFLLIIAVAAGSAWWFYGGQHKKEAAMNKAQELKRALAASDGKTSFGDFVVDVRDQRGEIRIAFYGIAVEFENHRVSGAAGERVDVRNAIHAVLKRRQVVEGLSSEGRTLIKKELIRELDRLLGERSVKNIYITRFEVI